MKKKKEEKKDFKVSNDRDQQQVETSKKRQISCNQNKEFKSKNSKKRIQKETKPYYLLTSSNIIQCCI